jgi:hypothetical protein
MAALAVMRETTMVGYDPVYYEKNRDVLLERTRQWKRANPEKRKAQTKRANAAKLQALAARRLALAVLQDWFCPCGKPLDPDNMALDHDHSCCDVRPRDSCGNCDRAAMHQECNRLIGSLGEDVSRLRNLADFVESFKE